MSDRVCPRCGQPYSYVERHRVGNNVYVYAVHYLGYTRGPDGRVHKRVRKCYLGPADRATTGADSAAAQAAADGEDSSVEEGSYRAVAALVGTMTPEDIERQVRELMESLREIRKGQGAQP